MWCGRRRDRLDRNLLRLQWLRRNRWWWRRWWRRWWWRWWWRRCGRRSLNRLLSLGRHFCSRSRVRKHRNMADHCRRRHILLNNWLHTGVRLDRNGRCRRLCRLWFYKLFGTSIGFDWYFFGLKRSSLRLYRRYRERRWRRRWRWGRRLDGDGLTGWPGRSGQLKTTFSKKEARKKRFSIKR